MNKIRIGKDIYVKWKFTINDQQMSLEDLPLTLQITDPKGNVYEHTNFTKEFDTLKIYIP